MDRFRRWISPRAEYEPLEHPPQDDEDHHLISSQTLSEPRFSRFEYGVFFLLGVSMLWAWYVLSNNGFPVLRWLFRSIRDADQIVPQEHVSRRCTVFLSPLQLG